MIFNYIPILLLLLLLDILKYGLMWWQFVCDGQVPWTLNCDSLLRCMGFNEIGIQRIQNCWTFIFQEILVRGNLISHQFLRILSWSAQDEAQEEMDDLQFGVLTPWGFCKNIILAPCRFFKNIVLAPWIFCCIDILSEPLNILVSLSYHQLCFWETVLYLLW